MRFDEKAFVVRVKEIRAIHDITQEQMAEELDISWQHLSKLECGMRRPSLDLVVNIADTYNVSLDYLLLGRECHHNEERNRILSVIGELTAIAQKI